MEIFMKVILKIVKEKDKAERNEFLNIRMRMFMNTNLKMIKEKEEELINLLMRTSRAY